MKKTIISFIAAFSFIGTGTGITQAKTPPEVIKPYKAYKTALAENNFETARERAYEAWQRAEKLLGDSRITGDLAFNYATIPPEKQNSDETTSTAYRASNKRSVSKKTYTRIEDAFAESIKLASYHKDIATEIEV